MTTFVLVTENTVGAPHLRAAGTHAGQAGGGLAVPRLRSTAQACCLSRICVATPALQVSTHVLATWAEAALPAQQVCRACGSELQPPDLHGHQLQMAHALRAMQEQVAAA